MYKAILARAIALVSMCVFLAPINAGADGGFDPDNPTCETAMLEFQEIQKQSDELRSESAAIDRAVAELEKQQESLAEYKEEVKSGIEKQKQMIDEDKARLETLRGRSCSDNYSCNLLRTDFDNTKSRIKSSIDYARSLADSYENSQSKFNARVREHNHNADMFEAHENAFDARKKAFDRKAFALMRSGKCKW